MFTCIHRLRGFLADPVCHVFGFDALPTADVINFTSFIFVSLKHIPSAFPEPFRADGLVV